MLRVAAGVCPFRGNVMTDMVYYVIEGEVGAALAEIALFEPTANPPEAIGAGLKRRWGRGNAGRSKANPVFQLRERTHFSVARPCAPMRARRCGERSGLTAGRGIKGDCLPHGGVCR